MTAAVSSNIELVGGPLSTLVLSGTGQEWALTMVNRINGLCQFIARDSTGAAVAFLYASSLGGQYEFVPSGAGVVLPVYKTQSWWFKQDASAAAPTLYGSCQG